jgi:hypothetical protein
VARLLVTLPALAAALALATPARAALPLVVVHRTDDAADCPDATALAAQVAAQMKRPALSPARDAPPGRGLDVQIYKSEEGFTAVVQASGRTRKLSDKGTTCGGLAAALAVSIAVMLDAEPLPPEPEPPPPPPAPEPPKVVTPTPEPARAPPPTDFRPSDVRRFRVALAASPVVTIGILRPFAGGVAADVEIRFGRFSIAAGSLALPGQTIDFAPGTVTLSLTAAALRGCVAPVSVAAAAFGEEETLRFALCVDALAGAIRGVGQGYAPDRTSTLPWAAGGASALFTQRIYGPLAWTARVSLVIPFLRQSFFVDNVGTAFQPASVGGALDGGLKVSIW